MTVWIFYLFYGRASSPRSWLQTDSGGNSYKIGDIKTHWIRELHQHSVIPSLTKREWRLFPLSTFRVIKVNEVFLNPPSWSNEFLLMTAITAWPVRFCFRSFISLLAPYNKMYKTRSLIKRYFDSVTFSEIWDGLCPAAASEANRGQPVSDLPLEFQWETRTQNIDISWEQETSTPALETNQHWSWVFERSMYLCFLTVYDCFIQFNV